jgi:hypothetical protein
MSVEARTQTHLSDRTAPEPALPVRGQRGPWFGWWVALCLALLAYNVHAQLESQRRILDGSRMLERAVAEARDVTLATNEQLVKVAELDAATAALATTLGRVASVNGSIRAELTELESTVEGMKGSVAHMDEQALQSLRLLGEITGHSDRLHATLLRSNQTSGSVAEHLAIMVRIQAAVSADLAAMNRKTEPIERLRGRANP